MITWGFVPNYGDAVTIGQPFKIDGIQFVSAYISVGGAGDIVWLNNLGEPQWFPGAQANQVYILGATQIVSSAVVNGVLRTTSASNMSWLAVNPLFNSP